MIFGKKIIGSVGIMGGVMSYPAPFLWSWTQFIEFNNDYVINPGEQILYTKTDNSYHSFARNNLVKQMRGDWLLMLDTDQAFEPDILSRMLYMMYKEPEVKVLTGIYQYKGAPYSPKIYRFTKNLKALEAIGKWDKPKGAGRYLIPIDSAGAGCLLIKKEVLEKVKKVFKEDPFDIVAPFSEDNSFFLKLKKLGIPVFCDPSIEIRHLDYKQITMDDYKPGNMDFKRYTLK